MRKLLKKKKEKTVDRYPWRVYNPYIPPRGICSDIGSDLFGRNVGMRITEGKDVNDSVWKKRFRNPAAVIRIMRTAVGQRRM